MADRNVSGTVLVWGSAIIIGVGLALIAVQPWVDVYLLLHPPEKTVSIHAGSNLVGVIVVVIGALLMAFAFIPSRRPDSGIRPGRARQIFAKLENDTDDAFFEHVADDVSWTVIGPHSHASRYFRKNDVRVRVAPLNTLRKGGAQLQLGQVLVKDNSAAVELSAVASASAGKSLPHQCCWIVCFDQGTIVRVREYDH
ncbi:MAG: nuclear transport factor 2 family protein [Hyphomicrobiales bacterium]